MAEQKQHPPLFQPASTQLRADGRDRHELHQERLLKVTDSVSAKKTCSNPHQHPLCARTVM
jgi:hypothetical protein